MAFNVIELINMRQTFFWPLPSRRSTLIFTSPFPKSNRKDWKVENPEKEKHFTAPFTLAQQKPANFVTWIVFHSEHQPEDEGPLHRFFFWFSFFQNKCYLGATRAAIIGTNHQSDIIRHSNKWQSTIVLRRLSANCLNCHLKTDYLEHSFFCV